MAPRQIHALILEDQDDERSLLRSLLMFTETFRADVTEASTAAEAENLLVSRRFDVIFLSADLQGGNGLLWLPRLVAGGFAPVIVLARNSDERLAVAAIKGGAMEYYPKNRVSVQILNDLLVEAVRAADRNDSQPGAGSGVDVPGQLLSLDRIRAVGGSTGTASRAPGAHALPPEPSLCVEVPFETVVSPTSLEGESTSTTAPATIVVPPSALGTEKGARRGLAVSAVVRNAPGGAPTMPGAEKTSADPTAIQTWEPRELAYRTSGIDHAMERFGLHRAPTPVENLPQVWTNLEKVLGKVAVKPEPELYAEIQDMAQRATEMIHVDFEIVPVLQTRYPEEKLVVGHCVNTAMLCIVLSRHCEYAEEETAVLAAAALLHDVSEFRSTSAPAPDPGEKAEFAVEVARSIGAPENVVQALQQYPEHADGTGPRGLKAREIVIDAQILLLADCFEHVYHERWERFGGAPLGALPKGETTQGNVDPIDFLVHGLGSWFQPRVLNALVFAAGFYSTGSIVELNNGAVARVVSQDRGKPTLPVVEVISTSLGEKPPKPLRLDLAQARGIAIRKTLSYNSSNSA